MEPGTRRLLRAASIESQSLRQLGVATPPSSMRRVHLHGAVLTPGRFLDHATVVIVGDRIEQICDWDARAGDGGRDVETSGLLVPGFVDIHNHVAYGAFPRWQPARPFHSRFGWRGKTRCDVVVDPDPDPHYRRNIADPHVLLRRDPEMLAAMALYSMVRAALGGTTAVLADDELVEQTASAGLAGFVRDAGDWDGRIMSLLDVGCVAGDALAAVVRKLDEDPRARLLVHVAEGLDPASRGELHTLDRKHLLGPRTGLIHAVAALEPEWQRIGEVGATLIWAPASNLRLYGMTVEIEPLLARGVPVLIAPDWPVSGSSTMLDELRLASSRHPGMDAGLLVEMATQRAADFAGATGQGRLEVGAYADVTVIRGAAPASRADAARAVVSAEVADVELVVVGGRAVCGSAALVAAMGEDDGLASEPIAVSTSRGPIERVVRVAATPMFEAARSRIAERFGAMGLAMAPLWEP